MPVTHCVCHNLPFERLLDIARASGLDFEGLRDCTKCASNCGMCEPYIRLMLQNGQTSFRPMSQVTINRILADASDANTRSQVHASADRRTGTA